MNYTEEMIMVDRNLPIKIFIHNKATGIVPKHWHNSLEINYIINGKATSFINGVESELNDDDIEIINIGDIHSCRPQSINGVCAVVILIPKDLFKEEYADIENIYFEVKNKEIESNIKNIVRRIGKVYVEENSTFKNTKIKGYLYELIYILLNNCSKGKRNGLFVENKHIERMSSITSYIKENYKEEISLETLSEIYGVSREHLSRIFKAHVGITFVKYLESVRLYYAHRDLLNTDYSVLNIALENGFPNVKSFITAFKNNYGSTPNKYRREIM